MEKNGSDFPDFVECAVIIWCLMFLVFAFCVCTDIDRKKLDGLLNRQSTGAQMPKEESWWDLLKEWCDLEKERISLKDNPKSVEDITWRQQVIVDQSHSRTWRMYPGDVPKEAKNFLAKHPPSKPSVDY